MRTQPFHFNNSALFALLFIIAAFLISSAIVAFATSKDDIVFPVAELRNCKSESECRAFCDKRDDATNIRACVAFAKKHNLISKEEADRADKFVEVAASGGPGGCKSEKECVNYCDNPAHMTECLDFAIRYKLIPPDEFRDAQKVLGALKSGSKTPGDCTRNDECLAYCENPAHLDECLAFAERAELLSPEELTEAKKFAPFIKSGETPGKCTRKAECESYCAEPGHVIECVTFAEKLGLMSAKEAELVKRADGRSPGDCARGTKSAEEAQANCAVFCNKEENRQTCFKFAVQIGLMTAEEATQIGVYSDFQACYAITTPKIRQCLDDNLGQKILKRLLEGQVPLKLEELEEMMTRIRSARDCTNRYADQQLQTFTDDPDALSCLDSELGKDFIDKIKSGQVACGDASVFQKKIAACMEEKLSKKLDQCFAMGCSEMKTCVQKFQKQSDKPIGEEKIDIDPSWKDKISTKLNACVAEDIRTCLAKDCSEMSVCLGKYGGKLEGRGKLDPSLEAEMTAKITACTKAQSGQKGSVSPKAPTTQSSPQQFDYKQYCPQFESAPSCSYAGAPGSQNYNLCKQCFPDK